MNSLSSLTEAQLVKRFEKLGRIRRVALVQTVLSLGEICRRSIHLAAGYSTLADYCRAIHGEERSKAWRIGLGAEAVANFPLAGELLRSRKLSVTALVAIKYALTADNHAELLGRAVGLTEDEARILASEFRPTPRRTDSVRVVSVLEPAFTSPPSPTESSASSPSEASAVQSPPTTMPASAAAALPRVKLVLKRRYEIHTTVSPEVHAQLEAVTYALSHKVPNGNLNDILAECFRVTLDVCERRKIGAPPRSPESSVEADVPPSGGVKKSERPFCESADDVAANSSNPELRKRAPALATNNERGVANDDASAEPAQAGVLPVLSLSRENNLSPRIEPDLSNGLPPPGPSAPADFAAFDARLDDRSRNVVVSVRRPVWERDEGRCSFRGPDGHRCGSRYQLEFDHWRLFCLGGEHSVANIRLLCSAHNRYEAERVLGAKLMRKYFRRGA